MKPLGSYAEALSTTRQFKMAVAPTEPQHLALDLEPEGSLAAPAGAFTPSFSDLRIKLSLVTELNAACSYCLEEHSPGGPLPGLDSKWSVAFSPDCFCVCSLIMISEL